MIALKKLLLAGGTRPGQIAFTQPGTFQWTVPPGVFFLCAVLVGGGNQNRGDGGGLSWFNGIPVKPGWVLTIKVAQAMTSQPGDSSVITLPDGSNYRVDGRIGNVHSDDAKYTSKGGGNGGVGPSRGGGGAGGYSGDGGNGNGNVSSGSAAGSAGQGGGGGGGFSPSSGSGNGGGGVGLLGEGPSGAGGTSASPTGKAGSGGADASSQGGGLYGGGGMSGSLTAGHGAVRLLWGRNRAFPSTRTGNM